MCCEEHHGDDLPRVVAQALESYRALQAARGWDWGEEWRGGPSAYDSPLWFHHSRYADWTSLFVMTLRLQAEQPGATFHEALWRLTSADPPVGLVAVELTTTGPCINPSVWPFALDGRTVTLGVLVRSSLDRPVDVTVAGTTLPLASGAADLVFVDRSAEAPTLVVTADGHQAEAQVVEPRPAGRLRVRSSKPCRWSVVDERGDGWFPDGVLRKWDAHGRPYFHGAEVELVVPVGSLAVSAARGMEHGRAEAVVDVAADDDTAAVVELEPERLYDAAAEGWFGGDLHVHLNYSGDYVATPADVAAMQEGEALHVLHLVAGNQNTALVYDLEAFEHWAGSDLPWTNPSQLARWGLEYRNDMFGHMHAFGATGAPSRYHSGHACSDHPVDWPPNAEACKELRALGATVGYTHPILGSPITAESPAPAFAVPRSCEARELVADAALGLVDSVDLIGPATTDGPVVLYHRLLNTGLRLAATAGTDTMVSMARVGPFSNPPGWARVYARLDGESPTAEGWQAAVRAGRTLATNGPWVSLHVAGAEPGTVLDVAPGTELDVVARCVGVGAEWLRVVGPDGVLAEVAVTGERAELSFPVRVDGPLWVAATVAGSAHPGILYGAAFAHTTPVYVDVAGGRVRRAADARWCLEWLDRFEELARTHGHFDEAGQVDDLVAVLDEARPYYRAIASEA
ncbi:MAG TPA: CehA/McbA family metallohydrolase [Acidimicrobiales bacterium]|nr:CehA/McbA family metallohydrolase [Acidimicrobiales bacterium]